MLNDDIIRRHADRFVYENGHLIWNDNYGPRARKGYVAGAVDSSGYIQIKLEGKCCLAHRIVWFIF